MSLITRRALGLSAAALGLCAALPALAQKSASQLDWEANQAAWLAENLKKPGWKASPSGVQFKRTSKAMPKGAQPKPESTVTIAYTGQTISEVEFDASPEGEPMVVPLKELIKGVQEAILMMRVGETWSFAIPAALGYGDRSRPKIPAGSALVYSITLVKTA